MRRRRLRTRLVASFVAVALVGVGTLAVLVIAILPSRLSQLVIQRQNEAAERAAEMLEETYRLREGWSENGLRGAAEIAAEAGGSIDVETGSGGASDTATHPPDAQPPGSGEPGGTDDTPGGQGDGTGQEETPSDQGKGDGDGTGQGDGSNAGQGSPSSSPGPGEDAGQGPGDPGGSTQSPGTGGEPQPSSGASSDGGPTGGGGTGLLAAGPHDEDTRTVEVPIVVDGRTVGTLKVVYPADGLPGPERDLESSLRWSILAAAAVAILVALGVALLVARRLGRPLTRLTRAARRLGSGDLSARAGDEDAPGELGELAATFDQMAEALAREDEVRRVLVADVAHELRTPVTILQASLEELVDGTVEPETDRLSSLHDEVLRLARILQDLESLAAAQAAGLEMTAQPVDLAEVASEAIERLRGAFATAEVEPHVALAPTTVLGDPARLDQVVTNLLTNAMKFTPPGGDVQVRVATMNGDARLEVEDSGPGIAPDEIDHVFERFWRGSAGRATSGSGVGLAVVAELVRAHHGRVEVTSAPGEGARFAVILPRA